MRINKRIATLLLTITIVVNLVLSVYAAEITPDIHTISIYSDKLYEVSVIEENGTVYARAEDLAAVYGGTLQFVKDLDRWSIPGAGDRLGLFSASGDDWITVETGMHDGIFRAEAMFDLQNLKFHSDLGTLVLELDNVLYVDLLESVYVLGGYMVAAENYLYLMIPRMNETEFFRFACKKMGGYAPLAVTTWRDRNDSTGDRVVQDAALILDMSLDILSEGKVWEFATQTYEEEYIEEVLIASMSISPMYSMDVIGEAWKLADKCYEVLSDRKIFALDQNGKFWTDQEQSFFEIIVDEGILEEYERFLLSDGLKLYMGTTGIILNCMVDAEKIGNIASGNIDLCKNLFIDNGKHINETIQKVAKRVLEKYASPKQIIHEAVIKNIRSNSAEKVAETILNLIQQKGVTYDTAMAWIRLLVQTELWTVQYIFNYDYGEMVTVQEYYKLQRALRNACVNVLNSDLPENEKLSYMHDCLQFFAHVKEASLRNTNETLTIHKEGTDAWNDYLEIMSVLPEEIAYSDYDFSKEKACVSSENVIALFDAEPPMIENGSVVNEFDRLVQQIDLGLALLGVNENEWGSLKEAYICNLDNDADLELVVDSSDPYSHAYSRGTKAYIVLDNSTNTTRILKSDHFGNPGTELVKNTQDNRIYIRAWNDLQDAYQIYYYGWDGSQWVEYAFFWEEHWDLVQDKKVPVVFTMQGKTMTREDWTVFDGNMINLSDELKPLNEHALNKVPSSAKFGVADKDLRSFYIAGEAKTIIDRYASVMQSREDYLCMETGDIGAGGESTVFILRDTQNRWLKDIQVDRTTAEFTDYRISLEVNEPLQWIDYAVIATPAEGGVKFDIATFHFDPNGINIADIFIKDGMLYNDAGNFQTAYQLVSNPQTGILDLISTGFSGNPGADTRNILSQGYWVLEGVDNGLAKATLSFGPDVVYIWGDKSYEAYMGIQEDGTVAIYFDFEKCCKTETPCLFKLTGTLLQFEKYTLKPKE